MNEIFEFYTQHGLWLTLIAIVGIIVLGILKYAKIFEYIDDENTRHYLYLIISIGLSTIGSLTYFLCTNQFQLELILVFITNVYTLNQTFYNIFCTVGLKTIFKKILQFILRNYTFD